MLHAPFYLYVSYAMVRYLSRQPVTRDELFAAGSGVRGAVALGVHVHVRCVQVVWPGSFAGASGNDLPWFDLLFLSFTNLTSVGLSDVLPVLDHARSVVMVQPVVGVLYIALVVSRLVGLTVARARSVPGRLCVGAGRERKTSGGNDRGTERSA